MLSYQEHKFVELHYKKLDKLDYCWNVIEALSSLKLTKQSHHK